MIRKRKKNIFIMNTVVAEKCYFLVGYIRSGKSLTSNQIANLSRNDWTKKKEKKFDKKIRLLLWDDNESKVLVDFPGFDRLTHSFIVKQCLLDSMHEIGNQVDAFFLTLEYDNKQKKLRKYKKTVNEFVRTFGERALNCIIIIGHTNEARVSSVDIESAFMYSTRTRELRAMMNNAKIDRKLSSASRVPTQSEAMPSDQALDGLRNRDNETVPKSFVVDSLASPSTNISFHHESTNQQSAEHHEEVEKVTPLRLVNGMRFVAWNNAKPFKHQREQLTNLIESVNKDGYIINKDELKSKGISSIRKNYLSTISAFRNLVF